MNEEKTYMDYVDEVEDKENAAFEKYEAERKEESHTQCKIPSCCMFPKCECL